MTDSDGVPVEAAWPTLIGAPEDKHKHASGSEITCSGIRALLAIWSGMPR